MIFVCTVSLLGLCLAVPLYFIITKIVNKEMHIWLFSYLVWEINRWFCHKTPRNKPIHIMLLMVDHHEHADLERQKKWLQRFERLTEKHIDADGRKLQNTFFYPYDQFDKQKLKCIIETCKKGYGDMELHWHHRNLTSLECRKGLRDAKRKFNEFGALITSAGQETFGFVHGNWALDNSIVLKNGRNFCGVNNEIDILVEEGCYADFTFPAFGTTAQPRKVNCIYYATDDPLNPKSYDSGIEAEFGKRQTSSKALMIFHGLLFISLFSNSKVIYVDKGCIQSTELPSKKRVDNWVKKGIVLKGQPNWIFIKLYFHGAHHPDAILGKEMDEALAYLERKYNDKTHFVLHYITAREAYNIVKAAEHGYTGNPNKYRDFIVKPYRYSIVDNLADSRGH